MVNLLILDALDLLKKCLNFNPNLRISVDEALKHPYLAEFSDPEEVIYLIKGSGIGKNNYYSNE